MRRPKDQALTCLSGDLYDGGMTRDDALTVARTYHRAWNSGDFVEAGNCLSDMLRVEMPISSYPGKIDFLNAVQLTREMASRVELLADFGHDDEALLLYDMTLPMGELRVAEHFVISDGQITLIRQVHDTATLRAAGFGQPGAT